MNGCRIVITNPADITKPIDFGRHFNVWGRIGSETPLPEDAVLRVELFSEEGALLRHVSQERKNNKNVFAYHPALTAYPEEMDPGRQKLIDFGFPELMVKDLSDPYASLRDATIKCWYSDSAFKAVIVSGTDVSHGMRMDDGINYTDENGKPYDALPRGKYTVRVTFAQKDGVLLAEKQFDIIIGDREEQALCRFNPSSHRARMTEWCEQNGYDITNDTLPGYLEPYLGKWLYHMGLLKMYIANDIPFYDARHIRAFVYLMQKDSTSYSCELPYLQKMRRIGDAERFFAYHYDTGEAILKKSRRKGKIIPFEKGESVYICRVDQVGENASENVFSLDDENVVSHRFGRKRVRLDKDGRFAVAGVICPRQQAPEMFALNEDNTYSYLGGRETLEYEFECGGKTHKETRFPGMVRYLDGKKAGGSELEFYNVFTPDRSWRNKKVKLKVTCGGYSAGLDLIFE